MMAYKLCCPFVCEAAPRGCTHAELLSRTLHSDTGAKVARSSQSPSTPQTLNYPTAIAPHSCPFVDFCSKGCVQFIRHFAFRTSTTDIRLPK